MAQNTPTSPRHRVSSPLSALARTVLPSGPFTTGARGRRRPGPPRHRATGTVGPGTPVPAATERGPGRREALAAAGLAAGGSWALVGTMDPATAAEEVPGNPAPSLPANLVPQLEVYQNWSGEIRTAPLWTVTPTRDEEVVELARWCADNGWKLRARGCQHNWSPLLVDASTQESGVLLVNLLGSMNAVSVDPAAGTVTAQAGATLETVLTSAGAHGLSILHHPAPGDITVGGALAIGAHGTAVPATSESTPAGGSFGSMSNLVLWLEAVVWDEDRGTYVLRRFQRDEPAIGPLLTHLGRAVVTRVQLRFTRQPAMRCRSYTTVPATELFARHPGAGRTVDHYLRTTGRMEIILFPFTTRPWLKTWTYSRYRPSGSLPVSSPYNYSFSDRLPRFLTDLVKSIQTGAPGLVQKLGPAQFSLTSEGLRSGLDDLWGSPKDLMLYVRPDTLRVTANGYAVHCRRADVQRVVNEFYTFYTGLNRRYAWRWRFPMNGPLEIRVTGVDRPEDVGVAGAVAPSLSPSRRFADHPEWDTIVWLDILTFPGTPYSVEYFRECERWIFSHFASYAGVRVEWSKGWGYGSSGAWQDPEVLGRHIPASFDREHEEGGGWKAAQDTLDRLDPSGIYSAPLHERLIPRG